jgi:hypothetical protein
MLTGFRFFVYAKTPPFVCLQPAARLGLQVDAGLRLPLLLGSARNGRGTSGLMQHVRASQKKLLDSWL